MTRNVSDVTAIIPLYNGSKFIKGAIDSIITQTVLPDEIIIVDDGSTDNSIEVVNNIESPVSIVIISQPNAGQSAARNRGVKHCTKKFIAFLDQDDYWYPRHIEQLLEPIIMNDLAGWSYCNFDQVDYEGKTINQRFLDYEGGEHPKINIHLCLSHDMYILPSATIIRREAFTQANGFDERLSGYEDDDLFIRLKQDGWENIYISEPLLAWRKYGASTTFSYNFLRSRRIFTEKILNEYYDEPDFNCFYMRDHFAPRLFTNVLNEYWRGIRSNNDTLCRESLVDMKYYSSFFKINRILKLKMVLMKFPGFIRFLYQLKYWYTIKK